MKATVMMPLCLGMALLTATAQAAPAIYPVDTARFLGTSKFDFKVEFGRINGRLVVADELTPTVSRMWDAETLSKFDVDGTQPQLDYEIVLERLEKLLGKKD